MSARAEKIVESRLFRAFIIAVILGAGVLAGVETNLRATLSTGSRN